ncbi:protein Niban-like protein [Lates japonicus]|uniref:Protein Niban-like protein n=1 Tax=Lates japonicus TaxID=270547 RepID=A0AAD3MZ23_LATJO|nr:protein Niban-like protein [Lates japonicus]
MSTAVVQDAASKKSNNLLLDISDLTISQYSLLGQTPPCSVPGSPAVHSRDSSSAVVEEGVQTVTAHPQPDLELHPEDKPDPSTTQSSEQSMVLLSPVIVVTQQPDEAAAEDAPDLQDIQPGADQPSMTDSTTAESSSSATPDSDTALTQEEGPPDSPTISESTNPIPDSPEPTESALSPLQSADVLAECAQSDQPATPETSANSHHMSEDASSVQPSCPSPPHSSLTDSPMRISLGSLNEAIVLNSTTPGVMQMMAQQTTDRAVYLTGGIKDSWEVERLKEKKQKEEEEKTEGRVDDEEKDSVLETRKEDEEEEAEKNGDHAEKEKEDKEEDKEEEEEEDKDKDKEEEEDKDKEEEEDKDKEEEEDKDKEEDEDEEEDKDKDKVKDKEEEEDKEEEKEEELLQSSQPMESEPEGSAELPLDSVAIIRELVTEVTEVDMVISPCPNSSDTP